MPSYQQRPVASLVTSNPPRSETDASTASVQRRMRPGPGATFAEGEAMLQCVQMKTDAADPALAELLTAAASDPAKGMTDAFLKALAGSKSDLTPAQTEQLVTICKAVDVAKKLELFKALDIPVDAGSAVYTVAPKLKDGTPKTDQADYTDADLALEPGEERVVNQGDKRETKFKVGGAMKVTDKFSAAELDLLFAEMVKMPASLRTNHATLASIKPAAGRLGSYAQGATALYGGIEKSKEAADTNYVDAEYAADLDKGKARSKDEDKARTAAATTAKTSAETKAGTEWDLKRGRDLAAKVALTEAETAERAAYIADALALRTEVSTSKQEAAGAAWDKDRKDRLTKAKTPTDVALTATEKAERAAKLKTVGDSYATYITTSAGERWDRARLEKLGPGLNKANKLSPDETAARAAAVTAAAEAAKKAEEERWDKTRGEALAKATPMTDAQRDERLDKKTDALFSQGVRHEIGHTFDNKAHASESFHQSAGWSTFADAGAFIAKFNGWQVPAAQAVDAKTLARYDEPGLAIVTACMGGSSIDAELPQYVAKPELGEAFATWFRATRIARVVSSGSEPRDYKSREKIDGGFAGRSFATKGFMHMSADLTANVASWNNFKAAFSPREWAAEWYAAWYDLAKPGDTPGQKDAHCASAPAAVKTWLAGLQPTTTKSD